MCNDKCGRIQTLGLGIRNGVAQKIIVDLHGLDWPASCVSRSLVLLGLCVMSNTSGESDEWDGRFEGKNVVAELACFSDIHSMSGVSDFTAMLELDAKMGASRLGSLFRDFGSHRVSNHFDDCEQIVLH